MVNAAARDLLAALDEARAGGLAGPQVLSKAEDALSALREAARAGRGGGGAEKQKDAERAALREELRRSVSFSGAKRMKTLKDLLIKWHPDRHRDSEEAAAFATEQTMMVNEAMVVAKQNAKLRGEL